MEEQLVSVEGLAPLAFSLAHMADRFSMKCGFILNGHRELKQKPEIVKKSIPGFCFCILVQIVLWKCWEFPLTERSPFLIKRVILSMAIPV